MMTTGSSACFGSLRTVSKSDSLMLYTEQSSTSASARCSTSKSFTESAKPEAKTSKPRSRRANDNSSAISGVSSMSRMRRKRTLLRGVVAGQSRLLARGRLQIQNPDAAAGRVVGAVVVLDGCAPGFERAHREGVALEIIPRVAEHFVAVPVVVEDRVAGVHARDGIVFVIGGLGPNLASRPVLLAFAYGIQFLYFSCGRGIGSIGAHTVSATVAAASAAPMF